MKWVLETTIHPMNSCFWNDALQRSFNKTMVQRLKTYQKTSMLTYKETPVTVTVGEKEFSKTYQQIEKSSVSVDDMLTMLQDEKSVKQVISDWHYGNDLRKKAEVRNSILSEAAGPEKSIDKAAKDFVKMFAANGMTITEEKARELVVAQMEAAKASA